MKEIVIRTLADLGPGVGLYGYCEACGRMERPERKALHPGARLGRRTGADSAWLAVRRMRASCDTLVACWLRASS